jgi:hypothetical protein
MAKKDNLKTPNEAELRGIAALFGLASQGLSGWATDDDFLMGMGSVMPEDIEEEGGEGRQKLREIIEEAELPEYNTDLDVEADDLQVILPAICSVLGAFSVPGIKPTRLKKFKEAMDNTFSEVSLDQPSDIVREEVKKHLTSLSLSISS